LESLVEVCLFRTSWSCYSRLSTSRIFAVIL